LENRGKKTKRLSVCRFKICRWIGQMYIVPKNYVARGRGLASRCVSI